ncbi:MAG: YhgE/Pip domain-containing protein [Roseburia sp.]|nr:YhgE/Pip domain-containing protein [Roseburia sp.]
MKNIWSIFTGDVKRLIKNPLALIIAIGLCIIPSLYAWFNIYANWDPYANTSNIKIAAVSEDKGYTMQDGTTENMGEQVLEQLKENTAIGWVFLDDKQAAVDGVYSGEYYAAVVISEDFTYSMYNFFKEDFKSPSITYYENEKKNAIAIKITDTAVSTLKQSINETFIEVVASSIFAETNSLSEEMENGDKFAAFQEKLENLNENLISYNQMIDTFIAGTEALSQSVAEAKGSIPGLSKDIENGAKNFSDTKNSLTETQTTLASFSENVQQTMEQIKNSIDQINRDISGTNLAEDAQKTADSLGQTAVDTAALQGQLADLQSHLKNMLLGGSLSEEEQKVLNDILSTIDSMNGGASDIQTAINSINQTLAGSGSQVSAGIDVSGSQVADTVNSSIGNMTQLLSMCSESVANIEQVYVNSLVPQMTSVIDSMEQMLDNVSTLLSNLNNTMGNVGTVFSGIEMTVTETSDSLEQVQTVLTEVSGKLTELLEKLDSVSEDEKVMALLTFLKGDPEAYGEFFSEPVKVTTEAVYPIENYGSAMTPFYSILAIWVGGTVLVALIKVKAEPKGLEHVKSYHLYFGRYLLFFVMGQIQAAIIVLGDIYLLGCQVLHPGLFWLVASLASFTFTVFIYSLALAFGDIGKALAVVIMVIQIAGSGGTFPIELLPEIYRNIYIFFPFPYAINAMRETIGGMYGDFYVKNLMELLIFAAVGLLIGLVIRLPFIKISHFMEERMEDTKMM